MTFGLGVRFKAAGEPDFTVLPVENAAEQTELLAKLRAEGFLADRVALRWQVMADPSRTTGDTR